MEENKQRFCDIMRFYVNETKIATQIPTPQKWICLVYREGIANDRTYQKLFVRFSDRNCSLNENSWSTITFEINRNQNFI